MEMGTTTSIPIRSSADSQPPGEPGGDGGGSFTGSLSGVDFNNFAGNQYFSITVPEPSTAVLGALGFLAVLRRRR